MAKIKFNYEGLTDEQSKAVKIIETAMSVNDELTEAQVKGIVSEQVKESGFKKEDFEKLVSALDEDNPESVKSAIKALGKRIDNVEASEKKSIEGQKTFNDNLMELVESSMGQIKSAANTIGKTDIGVMKAVGDMSIAANFTGASSFTSDVRNNLIESPYNRLWLRDILLNGTTDGKTVTYPQENGGEGGAAPWTDPTADKAQMDFDLKTLTSFVKWIAGYVIIDREMLDDIPFMNSWLRSKMLISLKQAENNFILNGTSDANPVEGILAAATAYTASTGVTAGAVNNVLDAAWGQIPADTDDFYNPTHTIMHPRDAVRIGLNQSAVSGDYTLPAGSVGFVNGKLNIGGLDVARTTIQTVGNFLTLDRNAAMFITKMNPELSVFVDAGLAKRNKIMLRIEERATIAIFNKKAIVKGTF